MLLLALASFSSFINAIALMFSKYNFPAPLIIIFICFAFLFTIASIFTLKGDKWAMRMGIITSILYLFLSMIVAGSIGSNIGFAYTLTLYLRIRFLCGAIKVEKSIGKYSKEIISTHSLSKTTETVGKNITFISKVKPKTKIQQTTTLDTGISSISVHSTPKASNLIRLLLVISLLLNVLFFTYVFTDEHVRKMQAKNPDYAQMWTDVYCIGK